jgi:hypothetical protein
MKVADILRIRLHNQQLSGANFKTPKEVVSWMGVMQAQEYVISKWAIGIRLPQSTEKRIDKSLDKGEILRTHLLRPTWHYVAAEDIHWMLVLSAPQQKAAMKFREKFLGLTPATYNKSNKIIEKVLSTGEHLTRKELVAILEKEKIDAKNERGGHLLFRAEIEGIICSGIQKGKEITYALLAERVKGGKSYSHEEALAKLAHRFFTSHGPATVQDFIWWSGLSITEGKKALELVKNEFESETIGETAYWFAPGIEIPDQKKSSCFLLPAFDEFIIGYADRTMLKTGELKNKSLFESGLFKTVILVNGKAIGNWKRVIKKGKTEIETEFFKAPAKSTQSLIKKAVKEFNHFVG